MALICVSAFLIYKVSRGYFIGRYWESDDSIVKVLDFYLAIFLLFIFEIDSLVAQAGLIFPMKPMMSLDFRPSGMPGFQDHVLFVQCWGPTPRPGACWVSTLSAELHWFRVWCFP